MYRLIFLVAVFSNSVSPINRTLASYKQIGEIVLRETEFEKTATRKIKRYKLKGC